MYSGSNHGQLIMVNGGCGWFIMVNVDAETTAYDGYHWLTMVDYSL